MSFVVPPETIPAALENRGQRVLARRIDRALDGHGRLLARCDRRDLRKLHSLERKRGRPLGRLSQGPVRGRFGHRPTDLDPSPDRAPLLLTEVFDLHRELHGSPHGGNVRRHAEADDRQVLAPFVPQIDEPPLQPAQ